MTISDSGILSSHWQQTGVTFSQGDFSYNGTVTIADLGILSSNWQKVIPAPPSGPDEVTVWEPVTGAGLELNWIDAVNGELGWRVQKSTDGQSFDWYKNLPQNTELWTDTNVQEGTRYWNRVRAYGNNKDTAYTAKKGAITVLPAPTDPLTSNVSDESVVISWTDNAADELGFNVYRCLDGSSDWDLVGTTGPDENWFVDTGLDELTYYVYHVEAVGEDALSAPSENTDPVFTLLKTPDSVQAVLDSASNLTISWNDTNCELWYEIWRTLNGGTPELFWSTTPDANETSHTRGWSVLETPGRWAFMVRGVNDAYEPAGSPFSAPVTINRALFD